MRLLVVRRAHVVLCGVVVVVMVVWKWSWDSEVFVCDVYSKYMAGIVRLACGGVQLSGWGYHSIGDTKDKEKDKKRSTYVHLDVWRYTYNGWGYNTYNFI